MTNLTAGIISVGAMVFCIIGYIKDNDTFFSIFFLLFMFTFIGAMINWDNL